MNEKIQLLKESIADARQAQQNETKSSAGDKYETSREMMTQEIEKYTHQLMEAEQLRNGLMQLQTMLPGSKVLPGSLVVTDKGWFYLAASMGMQRLEGRTVMCLSATSPLGKLLLGKQAGDVLHFNQQTYTVQEIG